MQQKQGTGPTGRDSARICGICSFEPGCIPWDLKEHEYEKLEKIVKHPPILDEGNYLFRVGENLSSVYAIRTGACKTYAFDSDGREYVLGFTFPGELIGFDGVYCRRHGCNAVVLQNTSVCALPYYDLAHLMQRVPNLREQVLRLANQSFGDKIVNASLGPEARNARFLLDLLQRTGNGDASDLLELPMSPYDIANYLRVTVQDVDSSFAYFRREKVISLDGSRLQILAPDRLLQVANGK